LISFMMLFLAIDVIGKSLVICSNRPKKLFPTALSPVEKGPED
jgi:hypothetical protein